ncbi:MAG: hypothetical protein ACI9UN_000555 [Granulosicoccus sp.]|jgi:hypothetical protein
MNWTKGDWIVRREVLSSGPWLGVIAKIIEDTPEHLISYIPEGSPFGFPDGDWPTPSGKHPWSYRKSWEGHGCLMIQRPEDAYAVWHFWHGPDREFLCWYINLQEPFRRKALGYDTQDLELDLIVYPDGNLELKDDELMDQRVQEGRWSAERVAEIRADASIIYDRLKNGERWWPLEWRDWKPDPAWVVPSDLPVDWATM